LLAREQIFSNQVVERNSGEKRGEKRKIAASRRFALRLQFLLFFINVVAEIN
jgi:precorrin-6x reductase